LLDRLGERYADVLAEQRRLLRGIVREHGGFEIDSRADEFFGAFPEVADPVSAALKIQRRLRDHAWPHGAIVRVRIGLHQGQPQMTDEGYVGARRTSRDPDWFGGSRRADPCVGGDASAHRTASALGCGAAPTRSIRIEGPAGLRVDLATHRTRSTESVSATPPRETCSCQRVNVARGRRSMRCSSHDNRWTNEPSWAGCGDRLP
jgi:hypothetical protein